MNPRVRVDAGKMLDAFLALAFDRGKLRRESFGSRDHTFPEREIEPVELRFEVPDAFVERRAALDVAKP